MTNGDEFAERGADVLIAGAGLAGLTAAFGFAQAGFDVVSSGPAERAGLGRTVALLDQSVAFLKSLGLWSSLQSQAAPLRALRLIDDTGALFPPRPVEFLASEIGLDAFGWNIENDRMAETVGAAIAQSRGVERISIGVQAYDFGAGAVRARLKDGRLVSARLAVGADGRELKARRDAGLEARIHRYPQSALTARLVHRLPHEGFSTEFHTRGGPFTLVPLPAGATAPNRSSLVWVMGQEDARRRAALDDEALSREIELAAHSLLGAMRIEGERGFFPITRQIAPKITAKRLALVGDAAHVLPPSAHRGSIWACATSRRSSPAGSRRAPQGAISAEWRPCEPTSA